MEFLKLWDIFLRRKWLIIIGAASFFLAVVLAYLIIPATYEGTSKLLASTSGMRASLISKLDLQDTTSVKDDAHETDVVLVTLRPLMQALIDELDLKDRKKKPMIADEMIKSSILNKFMPEPYIRVEEYEESEIIQITAQSSDRLEAQKMANRLAELYVESQRDRFARECEAVRKHIDSELEKIREEYYVALSAMRDFKNENYIIDLSEESANLLEKLESFEAAIDQTETELSENKKRMERSLAELEKREEFKKESYDVSENDTLKTLKAQLAEAVGEIAARKTEITELHPDFIRAKEEIKEVEKLILEEAKKDFDKSAEQYGIDPIYSSLEQSYMEDVIDSEVLKVYKSAVIDMREKYREKLVQMNNTLVKNIKIEIPLQAKKDIYSQLLEYRIQVGMIENLSLTNVRIEERAIEPYEKSFPRKAPVAVIGFILAGMWGLFLGFFREYIDDTIKTPEDLMAIESFSFLGAVPKTDRLKERELVTQTVPLSPESDSINMVLCNLRRKLAAKPEHAVLLTSCTSGEGTSSLVANIAGACGGNDSRIIVVDLNLRNPELHKFMGVDNAKGVSEVLEKGLAVKDAVVKSSCKGIDVLPAGTASDDSSRLLKPDAVKKLIDELRKDYAGVIVDGPPLLSTQDALLISDACDGIVLVMESMKIRVSTSKTIKQFEDAANQKLLGVVLNKLTTYRGPTGRLFYR